MVRLDPKKAPVYANLGYAYRLKGNNDKAIEFYKLSYGTIRRMIWSMSSGEKRMKRRKCIRSTPCLSFAYELNAESKKASERFRELKIRMLQQKKSGIGSFMMMSKDKRKKMHQIQLNNIFIGGGTPFVLIAGPCVIEDEAKTVEIAVFLKELTDHLQIPFIFKASFDKANRTSIHLSGPGLREGCGFSVKLKESCCSCSDGCPSLRGNQTGVKDC